MRNRIAVFLIFVSLFFAQTGLAQKPAPAPVKRPDYSIPFVNKTLPNGLEVIVLPDPSVPLVTVELAVRNGSFTEPPELHGLSHLYEHMFFKPNMARILRDCDSARSTVPNLSAMTPKQITPSLTVCYWMSYS